MNVSDTTIVGVYKDESETGSFGELPKSWLVFQKVDIACYRTRMKDIYAIVEVAS